MFWWVLVFWALVFSLFAFGGLGLVLLFIFVLLADEVLKTLKLMWHPVQTWKGTLHRSRRPHRRRLRRLQEQGRQ